MSAVFLAILSLVNVAIAGALIGQLQHAPEHSFIKGLALLFCLGSAAFGFWTAYKQYNKIKEELCSRG